jgi:hypothetical protein
MKLLFDESYRRGWFYYCATYSRIPRVRYETGLLVPVIAGFWIMPPLTTSSWSRRIAILNVC